MQDNRYFRTNHFYLAAYLLAKGLELVNIDTTDPNRRTFVFRNPPECLRLASEFRYTNQAVVNVHKFIAAIKMLKAKLSNEPSLP
jgi:hypothetical protein